MAPLHVARLRLFALCIAIACRTGAYAAVTFLSLKLLQNGSFAAYRPGTLAAWLGLCSIPALVLAPFFGPVAGSRWNRSVLILGTGLLAVVLCWAQADPEVPWLSVVGLLSLEMAFFGTVVAPLTSTLARPADVKMTSACLWLSLSAAGGVWLVVTGCQAGGATTPTQVLALAVVLLPAVLLVHARPAEARSLAQVIVKPLVAGARDVLGNRRAWHALAGLWLWFFAVALVAVALLRSESAIVVLRHKEHPTGLHIHGLGDYEFEVATWRFVSALAVGILFTTFNRHPYRHGGLALYGALIALGSVLSLRFWDAGEGALVTLGFALGLALSPLLSFYLTWTTLKHHGTAAALVIAGWCAGALVLAAILVNLGDDPVAARTPFLNILLGVTGFAFVASFASFFRPAMELTLETLLWPVYRIRAFGVGAHLMPACGPHLVIGNHAAWMDPLFFAKVVRAPIVPMMSSTFYDLPVISWFMRHVFGTIRVPDKAVRHEAPELQEAVAALDRGDCVVIFPEGYLRRKEEVPLRRFGRGVWQILKDRPTTPVFACWIEGGWGSYFSHRGGPPVKGKRPDFWRPIRIGVVGPITVDAATLGDHMATRLFLMQQVSEARRPLGLEPLALPAANEAEGEKE